MQADGRVIDEAICLLMRAPHSYTMEDVVELQCHGGPMPLRETLHALLEQLDALETMMNDIEHHKVEFVIDQDLWDADAVQAHPLVNTATCVIPHADLVRFLQATGHEPRILEVPAATKEGATP